MKNLTNNTLAFGNLKHRRKSYAVMIIGIILAMVFSSGIIFFASCIGSSRQEAKNLSLGKQDMIINNVSDDEIKELKNINILKEYALFESIGYAYTNSENADMGVSIAHMDDNAQDVFYLSYIEGKYPENKGEIAIEKSAMSKLGISDAKIGEFIDFDVLIQNGDDYLNKPVKKTYKLVGILDNKRSNAFAYDSLYKSFPAAFVSKDDKVEPGGKARTDCLAIINDSDSEWYDKLFNICAKYNTQREGNYYIETIYSNSQIDVSFSVAISVILVSVLLIASCMGIINSFNSNLSERKKQIGMLKTVGATQRQIINMFGREAFFISLLCIPVSLLISYFAVKIISGYMGEIFIFKPNFLVLIDCGVFSIFSVMLAALIPLVKASKISPVQSIRNIEFTRKMKTRKIVTQKVYNPEKLLAKRGLTFDKGKQIIVCLFLIISIVGSGFGFSMLDVMNDNMYTTPFDYTVRNYGIMSFDIYNFIDYSTGFTDNDIYDISAMQNVDEVYSVNTCDAVLLKNELTDYDRINAVDSGGVYEWDINRSVDDDKDSREEFYRIYNHKYNDRYQYVKEKCSIDGEAVPVTVNGYNPKVLEMLEPFVIDGKIDTDKILSGEEVIIQAPKTISFSIGDDDSYGVRDESIEYKDGVADNEKILLTADSPYKVGDKLDIDVITAYDNDVEMQNGDYYMPSYFRQNKKTVTIGAIIGTYSYDIAPNLIEYIYIPASSSNSPTIYTCCSVVNQLYPESKYSGISFKLDGEIDDKLDQEITSDLQVMAERVDGEVYSQYEKTNNEKRENQMIFICMLSIIILLLTISTSIVNNSISARIRASKREIGTIRAVGASQKELIGSYVRQLLSMLGVGCISGFGIYTILYIVYAILQKINHDSVDFKFTIWQSVVACIIIFVICSVNLLMKIRKEMKNSIIENIREL